jgi:hypothetical protein
MKRLDPKLRGVRNQLLDEAVASGWAVRFGSGTRFNSRQFDGDGCYWMVASRREAVGDEDMVIRITLNVTAPSTAQRAQLFGGAVVDGETEFKVVARGAEARDDYGWRGWVRRGVDVTSVALCAGAKYPHQYGTLAALLVGEAERCRAAELKGRTLVAVAGTAMMRQPEWFTQAAADLRAGRTVQLLPSGFGTGYNISARRGAGGHRACPELERQLGVTGVWLGEIDCD